MSDKELRQARWYFGGLSSAASVCLTHPLDLLKVLLQTQDGKVSMGQLTKDIIKKQGVLALYNGLSAALFRQMTYAMTRFGIYEVLKQHVKSDSFLTKVGMAAVAGAAGGLVGTPADKINVRMQNDTKLPPEKRRNYKHALDGLIRIYKEEGPKQLFSGASTATTRAIFMTVGQLSFYDQIKLLLLRSGLFQDNVGAHLTSSLSAGAISTMLTQPIDVVKTRVMNAKPGEYKGVLDCVKITAKGGPLAFYKGFTPALIRMLPVTVLVFMFYEQLRQNFGYIPEPKKPT